MRGHIGEKELALLAGGELEAAGRPEFKRHLTECEACASALASYRADRKAMGTLRMRDLGAGDYAAVRESVMARIRGGDTAPTAPPALLMLRWGTLAAGAIVALMLCVWWVRGSKSIPVGFESLERAPAKTEAGAPAARESVRREERVSGALTQNSRSPKIRAERARAPMRKTEAQIPVQAATSVQSIPAAASRTPNLDDVVVKLETADPNVIIIWLNSPRGEGR